MNKTIFGIATSDAQAAGIVRKWKAAGFAAEDISVLFPDNTNTLPRLHEPGTKASASAAVAGGGGLIIGGALAWLVGIGAVAMPGAGSLIAAGPLMAALAGAGIGAVAGGVAGTLVGFGMSKRAATQSNGRITNTRILLTVHTTDGLQRDLAKHILVQSDAEDISYRTQAWFAALQRL